MESHNKRTKRSEILLVDFKTNQQKEWFFSVDAWANEPLGIQYITVVCKKVKTQKWLQSSNFNFTQWTTLSSDKALYPITVQVTEALPAGLSKASGQVIYEHGYVKYTVYTKIDQKYQSIAEITATQAEFIYLLFSGLVVKKGIEIPLMEAVGCQKYLGSTNQKLKIEKSMNSSAYVQESLLMGR